MKIKFNVFYIKTLITEVVFVCSRYPSANGAGERNRPPRPLILHKCFFFENFMFKIIFENYFFLKNNFFLNCRM